MACCCTETLNLCDTPVCGSLELPLAAGAGDSGGGNEYRLVIDYLQTQITLKQEQTEGENITFDVSALNENFQYTGQVYDPNGTLVVFAVSGVNYDCVKFKTVLNVNI